MTSSRRRPPRSPIPTSARAPTTTRAASTRSHRHAGQRAAVRRSGAHRGGHDPARLPGDSALHAKGARAFFGFGSSPDFKDASKVIAAVDQGGLGLPDRDYYLKDDATRRSCARSTWRTCSEDARSWRARRRPRRRAGAQAVLQIETALAKAALDRVARREPDEHLPQDGARRSPRADAHLRLAVYLSALQTPAFDDMNVAQPEFIKAVDEILTKTPLADLRAYLRWHLLSASAAFLPKAFVDENFAFYAQALTGAKELRPRWKRCVRRHRRRPRRAARPGVRRAHFGPDGKARTLDMVARDRGGDGPATSAIDLDDAGHEEGGARQAARGRQQDRLSRQVARLLRARASSAATRSATRSAPTRSSTQRQLAKIGKPVDRTEWDMTPPTVNAYYDPLENKIVFPAGILQPPFFDRRGGRRGELRRHRRGRRPRADARLRRRGPPVRREGNLRDWWTPADAKAFEERAACVVDQYGGYTPSRT